MSRTDAGLWVGQRLPAMLALLAMAVCAGGCAERGAAGDLAPGIASSRLVEVPRPEPGTMDPAVAEQLASQHQEVVRLAGNADADPGKLSAAFAGLGTSYFVNGLEIPALACFENARSLAPEDPDPAYVLGLIHEGRGELEPAAAALEEVLSIREDDLPAILHLARVRLEQGRLPEARKLYRRALNLDPESPAAQYGLGRVAAAEGEWNIAVRHYETALARQPQATQLHYLLGLAYRNLGQQEKASRHLEQRGQAEVSFPDPHLERLKSRGARVGGQWGRMRVAAQAYVDGAYELAAEEYAKVVEEMPEDSRARQSLGMALAKLGDVDGAIEQYEAALAIDSKNAVVHHDLALLLDGRGEADAALAHLQTAIEIDPGLTKAHLQLARLASHAGNDGAALEQLDAAIALDPRNANVMLLRATSLFRLGRRSEALAQLAGAAELDPLNARARLAYGAALADLDRPQEALEQLRSALTVADSKGDLAQVHHAIGQLQARSGHVDGAIASFRAALAAAPDFDRAAFDLGNALGRTGDLDGARAAYTGLLKRSPRHVDSRIALTGTELLRGRYAQAQAELEAGLAVMNAEPTLSSALARLLATCFDAATCDRDRALSLARSGFETSSSPASGETMALALASAGRVDEAVTLQRRLVSEARERGDRAGAARMQDNLARYSRGEPGRLSLSEN